MGPLDAVINALLPWIIRLAGALPDTPADIVATYADGQSETFRVDSLAGRTDRPAGPYRGTISVSAATADPVTPAPVDVSPAPAPAPSTALHTRTGRTLTLRDDFAACVSKVDALARVIEPGNPNPIVIPAIRRGNTWELPADLDSYPVGNRPNTWRIRLTKKPPAGVTYHTSIMQTFLRVGDTNTYPPTTRK
mgnify:FL=1